MLIIGVFSHISNLPIEIYDTFVLEQKHGFNKQVRFSICNLKRYFYISLIIEHQI